jgi:hypothetical protein
LAAWLAWRLRRRAATENRAASWLTRTLALTAASALIGGAYHGFAPNFSAGVAAAWWRLTLLAINAMSVALAVSWLHEVVPLRRHRLPLAIIAVKSLGFAVAVIMYPRFVVAIADYASTLLAWLIATLVLRRAWRSAMGAALALSALAAMVQQLRWAPAAWFNHNDLYHVVQALALVALYRAGIRFGPTAR